MRNPDLVEFLLRRYAHPDSGSGCKICNLFVKSHGYCEFVYLGKTMGAHRALYMASNGAIPDGLVVRHTCDDRRCINPDHLVIGTHGDNMNDMKVRNRSNRGKPLLKNRGTNNPGAKLDEEKVATIRARAGAGEAITSLAAEFGLTTRHTWAVATGRAWSYVT